jgi:hypothetical protein
MMKGALLLLFVVMAVIILFLAFQVNDNVGRSREARLSDHERVQLASKLKILSATQHHPLFAHEHAQHAKFILDEVISKAGGVLAAERDLKLPPGRLATIKQQIDDQFEKVRSEVMSSLVQVHQHLDLPENEDAGLLKRSSTVVKAKKRSSRN